MADINSLISHRFRGFSKFENTIAGVEAALDFGVMNLEFDIRVTGCGTPVIYHDEFARGSNKRKKHISQLMAKDFGKIGGTFDHIPSANALFSAIAKHKNKSARLLIDIKDAGFEEEIHALVCLHRLQDRVVYVSWVPNVLYAMHELAPRIPLCLSYWCKNPNKAIRLLHDVHDAKGGHVPRLVRKYIHGERSGWYVDGAVKGQLREMIKRSRGSICVPQNMVSKALVDDYHADGITVSTFSYTQWKAINVHEKAFNIDLYFIDNKAVFDQL